jgi:hypothetical protein
MEVKTIKQMMTMMLMMMMMTNDFFAPCGSVIHESCPLPSVLIGDVPTKRSDFPISFASSTGR